MSSSQGSISSMSERKFSTKIFGSYKKPPVLQIPAASGGWIWPYLLQHRYRTKFISRGRGGRVNLDIKLFSLTPLISSKGKNPHTWQFTMLPSSPPQNWKKLEWAVVYTTADNKIPHKSFSYEKWSLSSTLHVHCSPNCLCHSCP